jgi:RNA polymerase sigma factor (sigma-70 family)
LINGFAEKNNKDIDISRVDERIISGIKRYLLQRFPKEILDKFQAPLNGLIAKYLAHLPRHVAESEVDDLTNVARLELFESIKSWDPRINPKIWPLAQQRITGAMRDHIRYLTKSDPSRLYDWITNAAYLFMSVEESPHFERKIEDGFQLDKAMRNLTEQEKQVVIMYYKDNKTFKEIAKMVGLSESQISRICRNATNKMKEIIE